MSILLESLFHHRGWVSITLKLKGADICRKIAIYGSPGIATSRNCTNFLKIGFVVARNGFYSYYIHQGNKSQKERKIVRKKLSFMHTKRFKFFFKNGCNSVWVQFTISRVVFLYIHIYKYEKVQLKEILLD